MMEYASHFSTKKRDGLLVADDAFYANHHLSISSSFDKESFMRGFDLSLADFKILNCRAREILKFHDCWTLDDVKSLHAQYAQDVAYEDLVGDFESLTYACNEGHFRIPIIWRHNAVRSFIAYVSEEMKKSSLRGAVDSSASEPMLQDSNEKDTIAFGLERSLGRHVNAADGVLAGATSSTLLISEQEKEPRIAPSNASNVKVATSKQQPRKSLLEVKPPSQTSTRKRKLSPSALEDEDVQEINANAEWERLRKSTPSLNSAPLEPPTHKANLLREKNFALKAQSRRALVNNDLPNTQGAERMNLTTQPASGPSFKGACEACMTKKIRCDEPKPCRSCVELGLVCKKKGTTVKKVLRAKTSASSFSGQIPQPQTKGNNTATTDATLQSTALETSKRKRKPPTKKHGHSLGAYRSIFFTLVRTDGPPVDLGYKVYPTQNLRT